MGRRVLPFIFLIGLWSATALAANPYLQRARTLYRHEEFAQALRQLQIARSVPTNDVDERVEIFDLLARCEIAEGQRQKAEQDFTEILSIHPRWEPSRGTSPKIRDVFDSAKRRAFPTQRASFRLISDMPTGARVELTDPWDKVKEVRLSQRPAGNPNAAWRTSALTSSQGQIVIGWGQGSSQPEWYLEGLDAEGHAVARLDGPPPTTAAVATSAARPAWTPTANQVETTAPPKMNGQRIAAWTTLGVAAGVGIAAIVLGVVSNSSQQNAVSAPYADAAQSFHSQAVTQQHWAVGLGVGAGLLGLTSGALFVF